MLFKELSVGAFFKYRGTYYCYSKQLKPGRNAWRLGDQTEVKF